MHPLSEKLEKIKLIIFDVDGVLTDGKLFYTEDGKELKAFHSRDGVGIKLLQSKGYELAIISGRNSPIVSHRMNELNIRHVYQGQQDKLVAYNALKSLLQLNDQQIAYVGDDLPDLAVMQQVGFAITVGDAPAIMRQYAHYQTRTLGGHGVAREIADLFINPQFISRIKNSKSELINL